jgi:putative tryptophan/tyrosine transport system substrate-binding protein
MMVSSREGNPMSVGPNRRALIAAVGGAAVWPLAARAQQPTMPVVGLLTPANLPGWAMSGIHAGLEETGYVEGRNLTITIRSAEGQFDRLPVLATDLVKSQVAVILATGSPLPARAAKAATTKIPIVFAYGGDPVADGLVDSLNRPVGNVTGATFIGTILLAKRIELLRELMPQIARVALLVNPKGTLAERQISDANAASQELGLRIDIINISQVSDIETAFSTMRQLKVDAFIVSTDPFFGFIGNDHVIRLALHYKIPGIYNALQDASAGGLISYGPDKADTWRQAAIYVGRVLKGEKVSDLPVMQPTKFELVINLKTAKALGLNVPPTLLARADEVIE